MLRPILSCLAVPAACFADGVVIRGACGLAAAAATVHDRSTPQQGPSCPHMICKTATYTLCSTTLHLTGCPVHQLQADSNCEPFLATLMLACQPRPPLAPCPSLLPCCGLCVLACPPPPPCMYVRHMSAVAVMQGQRLSQRTPPLRQPAAEGGGRGAGARVTRRVCQPMMQHIYMYMLPIRPLFLFAFLFLFLSLFL